MIRTLAVAAAVAVAVFVTAILPISSSQASVVEVGLDLDTSGNAARSVGAVQACASVQPGDALVVDFWVTGADGVAGFSYNLHFDPSVVNVTAVDNQFMIVNEGEVIPFEVIDADWTNGSEPDPLPATTGNIRVDFADISLNREGGNGVLSRITLKAIAAGDSELTLSDDLDGYFAPTVLDGNSDRHFVNSVQNGLAVVGGSCGQKPVPTPLDIGGLGGTIPGGAAFPAEPPGVPDGTVQPTEPGQTPAPGESPGADDGPSVAVDVVPSENEATIIGEVETCASAEVGDKFIVDLVINDVEDLLAFDASVAFDGSVLDIRDRDVKLFLASGEGSQVVDTSRQTPDNTGRYATGGVDTADPLSPESGSGVLVRLTIEATSDGTSELSLAGADDNADGKDDRGVFLRNVDGGIIGDEDEDTFFDGPVAGAKIIVGDPCEDSDAKVVAAPAGEGSGDDGDDGSDALPFVIGGAVALGLIAAAGAGYVAYRRRRESGLTPDVPPSDEPPSGGTPL